LIKKKIKEAIDEAVIDLFGNVLPDSYEIEKPKKEIHGDYATNIALILKNKLKKKPLEIAEKISQKLSSKKEIFSKIEVAKPGFINFWISLEYYKKNLNKILEFGKNYGRTDLGKGKRVLIEFVSANPTGPLHIGHGRGAAYGDSLARILDFAGYRVIKEYYINDRGTQMEILGKSVYLRAKELSGENIEFPEDYYKGDYIYDIAKEVLKTYPDLLKMSQEKAISICRDFAFNMILKEIKEDLERFRVIYDSWYSEKSLYEKGKIDKVLSILKEKGLIYEKEGALWFKATAFGDEKDRVIIRSNGEYTYFASDIAYHYEKFNERKFDLCINIWGIDHHGYVPRIKGVLKGLGIDPERLKIILIQMVNLIEKGKLKSMSTRKGEFVTLKELMDDVGVDAIRFIFLSRSLEAGLDFDVELAKKQSQENPVYYVQYAHARICSVFKKAKEKGIEKIENTKINWALLSGKEEIELMKLLEEFPSVVEASALYFAPYKITYYLLDLAKNFHEFYTNYRILGEDENLTHTRLALCLACKNVFKNGLELLGVSAPEKM